MSNPYFRFKQFTIWHDQCAMKVNTDGVLLGAWVTVKQPGHVLDIGTGTGIVALMLAQRGNATVHGVEVEENACKQARFNAFASPWKDRIEIFYRDFKDFSTDIDYKYDLIVTNPPYFSNSLKNPDSFRMMARHNESLPVDVLLKGVSELLTDDGIFGVILPIETVFEDEAFIYGLKCTRRMLIRSLPEKQAIRQILEFKKISAGCPTKPEEMSIYQNPGVYSTDYINLTREFYLNF